VLECVAIQQEALVTFSGTTCPLAAGTSGVGKQWAREATPTRGDARMSAHEPNARESG